MVEENLGVEKAQKFGATEFLADIPAGVYWADNEGKFLYCNKEAADILGYDSPEELMQKNIYDLYFDPKKRDNLLDKMRKKKGRMKAEVVWKRKNGLEVFINEFAEFIHEDGEEAGVCGIFIDATYEKLFDDLNAGIYRIGPDMYTVQRVNTSVARMFGFKSPEDMEGEDIRKYYKNRELFKEFIEKLKQNTKVENFPLEMKKVDGESITISVSCRLLKDKKGETIGREGTFTDITEQKRLKDLLEQPLGVYEAELKGNEPTIIFCNETFVKMFGYTSKDDMIGMNIYDLYANKEDIPKFEKALREADQKGESVTEHLLEVRKKKKEQEEITETFWIEIYCYPVENENREIIGRRGIILDVSDKIELKRILRRRKDIQRFIHGLIAPMMSIHATTQVLAKEVERRVGIKYGVYSEDRFREKKSTLDLYKEIQEVSQSLAGKIEETISICRTEEAIDGISIKNLINIKDTLRKEIENIARRIIEVRELHKGAYKLLSEIQSSARTERSIKNSRRITDSIRLCFVDLDELDSIYSLYLAQSISNKSKIAYYDVEGLRQLMMRFGDGDKELFYEFERTNIVGIIDEIIDMYRVDAFLKGIVIKTPQGRIPDVEVAQEPIRRMFSYIIQNAVKYSFKRDGYINIDFKNRGNVIQIDIENYGVGILPEEIKEDKIYQYGFRGEFSQDRNRTGSGIGLAEAKRIIEAHEGEIKVESIAVGDTGMRITHDTPHKTTVSIILPTNQKKEGD